jgi:hypothetical protein
LEGVVTTDALQQLINKGNTNITKISENADCIAIVEYAAIRNLIMQIINFCGQEISDPFIENNPPPP